MIKELIIQLLISIIFPAINALRSTDKFLAFMDTWTIIGCIFIIFGIFYGLNLAGYFDIMSFMVKRGMDPSINDFDDYKAERVKNREKRKNTPLFCGIIIIVLCFIFTSFIK